MTATVLSRQECAAMVLGGPTVVLDLGVNTEVISFVLSGPGLPTVYLSGDNASIAAVAEIARRAPAIDAAVLHAGAARGPTIGGPSMRQA